MGFTLVETLIALFIFSLSVVVVMAVLSTGISGTTYARNKVIATYLAQEGIEYFRNMRDTSMLYTDDKKGWNNFIVKLEEGRCNIQNGLGCWFDNEIYKSCEEPLCSVPEMPIMKITVKACSEKCPALLYNNGAYGYHAGENSVFTRKISFKSLSETDEEIKIFSEVSWNQQGRNSTVLLSENLSAWIE